MNESEIKKIVDKQRAFFHTGATIPVENRMKALYKMRKYIKENEHTIASALKADLGKSHFESYMVEIGLILSELTHILKHIRSYAAEKRVPTPIHQYVSRSYKKPCPYGVTLIMSPWNYPFLLTMGPLIDSIAAGNTAVVKPSAYSPSTSKAIRDMMKELFPEKYICVITGGRAENTALLNQKFDYIFFTGSKAVGQEVMRKASENLTPVTLELGGKSPVIVTRDADIPLAAKRIVFGKFLNLGQTCVAPDYVFCEKHIKKMFIKELKEQIVKQYSADPMSADYYGKIVNEKHFERLRALIDPNKVVHGGKCNPATLQIEPTVMDNVTFDDAVMKEEIFGPILPIIEYENLEDVISKINSMDSPLALYLFTSKKETVKTITERVQYGGGCINDTIIHLASSNLPFGGVGASGMGSYHGKAGFMRFSHIKSIVDKKTWLDLPMRYEPFSAIYDKMIHMFMK